MPGNHLTRLLMSVLMLGCCLTPPVGGNSMKQCLRVVDIYPVCEESYQPRYTTIKPSILNQAMLGVDAFTFDQFGNPNAGFKDQIFIPGSPVDGSPDTVQLNDFIGRAVQDLRCPPSSSPAMRTLHNYDEFRAAMSESVSLKSGDDIVVGCRRSHSAVLNEFTSGPDEEVKLVEFFKRGGEIVLGEVRCQTHALSVNLYAKPRFTRIFFNAVRKLVSAAKDPVYEASRKIFFDFVKAFGTHFQDETSFGSRLVMTKLFARRAANTSENAERLRCVSSSFTQNLYSFHPSDDIALHFSRNVARCADSEEAADVLNSLGLPSARILAVGTVPLRGEGEAHWRPVPIYHRLQKMADLFQEDWFDCLPGFSDGELVRDFFEKMLMELKNISPGASYAAARNVGCGYNSNCNLQEKCLEDNSTAEGHTCVRHCDIQGTCPDHEVCVDDSLLGYSCMRGCGYTSNCSDDTECVDNDSLLGYSCMRGCGYTSNCSDDTECVDNDSLPGYSCMRGCGYTSNCSDDTKCVDDDSSDGYSCRESCNLTATCPPQKVCVDDDSDAGFTCREPCTVPGSCASDEACYAEPHSLRGHICVPTKPGRAVIMGGWGGSAELASVESVNFRPVPELPYPVHAAAAAVAQNFLYFCGGRRGEKSLNECFRVNIKSLGEWEVIASAPIAMYGHSAVSIGESLIWFISRKNLIEFDAGSQSFSIMSLPFYAHDSHCSVSNGTHAYVIGAGNGQDEIWVNVGAMSGSEWRPVGSLTRGRTRHACLWYGSNIMVTGGYFARDDVEMFNTETGEVWAGENLLTGRHGHAMMLLDGMPTVLGGVTASGWTDTFESFSLESNRWTKVARTLSGPRDYFTFAEF